MVRPTDIDLEDLLFDVGFDEPFPERATEVPGPQKELAAGPLLALTGLETIS
jgi:hypothetical protein